MLNVSFKSTNVGRKNAWSFTSSDLPLKTGSTQVDDDIATDANVEEAPLSTYVENDFF